MAVVYFGARAFDFSRLLIDRHHWPLHERELRHDD